MSAHVPDPTRERIRDALHVVGIFAQSLGVAVDARLTAWERFEPTDPRGYSLPRGGPLLGPPLGGLSCPEEALGWTVLAHWIEHGGHPIERHSRIGGASAVGWRVSLAGSTWSRAVASTQDHARVAELAAALLVLRRWVCPVRPWGLRDLQADSVDRAQREASVRALGPRPAQVIDSPIPADYLAAHGSASE